MLLERDRKTRQAPLLTAPFLLALATWLVLNEQRMNVLLVLRRKRTLFRSKPGAMAAVAAAPKVRTQYQKVRTQSWP